MRPFSPSSPPGHGVDSFFPLKATQRPCDLFTALNGRAKLPGIYKLGSQPIQLSCLSMSTLNAFNRSSQAFFQPGALLESSEQR